ncbi:MAG: BatA domain-containing protein [Gemmataceae bacterium]
MEFFYHPWYMAAGGLLVSSPILIHLINRMRYKRIRWAAMEFLLKSQKRNRRKLIIEQLILLLLRILLVLLAAFLVARFVYGAGTSRGASHLVILDDTMSMHDRDREGGKDIQAFDSGIEQIKELARNAARASSVQNMRVYLLSELGQSPLFEGRLGDRSVEEIDTRFAARGRKASLSHVSPLVALTRGRDLLGDERTEGQRILHFVSDFRDRDWTTGPDADKLHEEMRGLLDSNINLNLVDVASPARLARSKAVSHNNNVSIVDLRAETRVAIEDADVEFTVLLMNYGQAKEQAFIEVFINGEHDLTRDVMVSDLEPGKIKEHSFTLRFARRGKPGSEISERDTVEQREQKRRLEREQFHIRVTARQTLQAEGLLADNVRDMVLEVRKKIPTLVVDGNKPEGRGEGSDIFHLQSFYAASGVYEIEQRSLAALEKTDLDLYPMVLLLNVAEAPEPVIRKLKTYVENGGSLCWFLGEEVKPDHYNNALFKNGLFPVLLADRPFDPIAAAGIVDPEQKKRERERLRQTDPTPKILFPKPESPLVRRLGPFASLFRFLGVNLYWQTQPRSRWDPDQRQTESLIVLPNTGSVDKYKARAMELSQLALTRASQLAEKEAEFKRYLKPLEEYQRQIRNTLAAGELYRLGENLEKLLTDQGVDKDPEKPNLADLWKNPEMKALAAEIREFRETVLYGDPLLVSRQSGKGRVVAFLTTAGTSPRRGVGEEAISWNNWGAGERAVSEMYPLFLLDLHRFLVAEGQAPQRLLGEDVRFAVDPARYAPQFTWTFLPQPDFSSGGGGRLRPETQKETLAKENNQLAFTLANIQRPGVYRVQLTLLGEGADEDRQEVRAFAYNVDAATEGDLKRAIRDRLEPEVPPSDGRSRGKLVLRVPGESYEAFQEQQPDASESSLLYLILLLVLIAEQAMAVHLSYHTRGDNKGTEASPGVPSPHAA